MLASQPPLPYKEGDTVFLRQLEGGKWCDAVECIVKKLRHEPAPCKFAVKENADERTIELVEKATGHIPMWNGVNCDALPESRWGALLRRHLLPNDAAQRADKAGQGTGRMALYTRAMARVYSGKRLEHDFVPKDGDLLETFCDTVRRAYTSARVHGAMEANGIASEDRCVMSFIATCLGKVLAAELGATGAAAKGVQRNLGSAFAAASAASDDSPIAKLILEGDVFDTCWHPS